MQILLGASLSQQKNRDKIHEIVGFLVKNRDILKMGQHFKAKILKLVKITKFGYKIALFWTFKLFRKMRTKSRKIGTVGNLA